MRKKRSFFRPLSARAIAWQQFISLASFKLAAAGRVGAIQGR